MKPTTWHEFLGVVAWLQTATGKLIADGDDELGRREREARTKVYFELLADVSAPVLMAAAKNVARSHVWATFPSAAEIYQAAVAITSVATNELPPAKAWELAWNAACSIDPGNDAAYQDREGNLYGSKTEYHMAKLPEAVAEAVRRFGGLKALANEVSKFAREPFMRVYVETMQHEQRKRLLPPALKKQIETANKEEQPAPVRAVIGKIGVAS